jgi:GT2 family glycosyltransferase
MKIAIGIPTYNRASVLLDTIRDALQQEPPADEIVVVDQSDWYPDGAREELLALVQEGAIRCFRQETANLPKARNRILAETGCDIVIFIDDDVQLSPGFVAAHLANYRDDAVWAVCGHLTERDIPVRPHAERTWPKALDYKLFDLGWTYRVEDFGNVKGCNHSVRRETMLALGGYDEAYIGVALREETDLAFRIELAGGTIRFDPVAHLHHLRALAGGCRVSTWGEWTAGCAVLRFSIKHRKQLGVHLWAELWHAYRLGVLNQSNLRYPLRIVWRSIAFALKGLSLTRSVSRRKAN